MTHAEHEQRSRDAEDGSPVCGVRLECGGLCIHVPGHDGDHVCVGDESWPDASGVLRVEPGSCVA
jgi:hypothetical protein